MNKPDHPQHKQPLQMRKSFLLTPSSNSPLALLFLLGILALSCNVTQFFTSPTPSSILEENAGQTPTNVPFESPTYPPEGPSTPSEETHQGYSQYLPILSGGAATGEPKSLPSSPTPIAPQISFPPISTPTAIPTSYPTITPMPLSYLCIPPQSPQLGLVTKVVDGDTIRVLMDGKEYKVRYIGVDAPESTNVQEAFGKEATRYNAQLVRDQIVELYRDVSETDRHDRLLRYVVTSSVFVNLKMIEEGYAKAVTYPPDVACQVIFQQAERTARELGKGLWASAEPFPTSNCDPAYPDVCIPSPPPDLDCSEVSYRNFRVLPPDPHGFDQNNDGIACEK